MLTDQEVMQAYSPLYARFANIERLMSNPPLLAHYTSIPVLEKILQTETIWLSNPLFMNDLEEMRFGLNEGAREYLDADRLLAAGGDTERAGSLQDLFQFYFSKFESEGALDTYVFCLSEHDPAHTDGLLSMWRGYGGYGSGCALIFNPAKIPMMQDSVLKLATVSYASTARRLDELKDILRDWEKITADLALPKEKLYLAAFAAFSVLKVYALTSKHAGFLEEKEWRLIYAAENDPQGLLKNFLSHHIGPRGVEPKLKLELKPLPGVLAPDFKLSAGLEQIILGPTVSTPLAFQSISRMMDSLGRSEYKSCLRVSTIPLRGQ